MTFKNIEMSDEGIMYIIIDTNTIDTENTKKFQASTKSDRVVYANIYEKDIDDTNFHINLQLTSKKVKKQTPKKQTPKKQTPKAVSSNDLEARFQEMKAKRQALKKKFDF